MACRIIRTRHVAASDSVIQSSCCFRPITEFEVGLPVAGEQDESTPAAVEPDTVQSAVEPQTATIEDDSTTFMVPLTIFTEPPTTTETPTKTTETSTTTTEMLTTTTEILTTTIEILTTTTEPVTVDVTTEPVTVDVMTVGETTTTEPETTTATSHATPEEVVKDKLSEQIRKILRHYQGPDPKGFPGAPIPDPLQIPPIKKNIGLADMTFFNMTVHGLSKFKVENVNTDLKKMQVYVQLKIDRMYVLGNYTLRSWFGSPAAGPFNVTLIDVDAEAAAALVPDEDGVLQANETEMDMRFRDCELDFRNLGFTATLFQGVISTVGSVLFDGIKPFIISEVNNNLRADVNAQVKAITGRLPRITVPVPDMAINEGRLYVRRMGYDPYRVTDRHVIRGPVNVTVDELVVRGLSNFRRVDDVGLQVRGPVLQLTVHVITGPITGTAQWRYRLLAVHTVKAYGRTGASNFSAEHIQVRAVVNQTLDIRNKPVLDRLDIEVGKVAVRMDRAEPLDYVIEIMFDSLPALLRHIIVDALEEPIKMKVQTILNDVQLEQMVEERLPELDRLVGD